MKLEIIPHIYQYFIQLNSILFTLNSNKFAKELNNNGFQKAIPGSTNPDGLVVQEGDYATKYNSILNISESKMTITIIGTKTDEMVRLFQELKSIFVSCDLDVLNEAKFFEFDAEFTVHSAKKASETISNFVKNNNSFDNFDRVFGEQSMINGIRINPRKFMPNSTNYYDFRLEPLNKNPSKYYGYYIYRNSNQNKTEKQLEQFEESISEIIDLIENPNS